MPKIELPEWVYEVFFKYHNVALPNACMNMDRKSLKAHLERKTGCKIRIRVAQIKHESTFKFNKDIELKPYLIAEEK